MLLIILGTLPPPHTLLEMNTRPNSSGETAVFRISRTDSDHVIDVRAIESIEPAIRASKRGRYHIDEISADPFPCGHKSRGWGVAIKLPDGSVAIEPDPWDS